MLKQFEKSYEGKGKYSFLLTAGVHGNEYTALFVIPKLIELIKGKKDLFKSITVFNGINLDGIKKSSRDFIEKERSADLNRAWEEPDTYKDVVEKIDKLIEQHDVIIDIHASPVCSEFVLVDNDDKTSFIVNWMTKAGVPYCIRECVGVTIKKRSWDKGKIGFTFECNGTDLIDEESAKNTAKLILSMIENVPEIPDKISQKELFYDYNYRKLFFTKEGVVVYEKCKEYKKGDVLAKVFTLEGEEIEKLVAPEDGWMIAHPNCSFVRGSGEEICYQVRI